MHETTNNFDDCHNLHNINRFTNWCEINDIEVNPTNEKRQLSKENDNMSNNNIIAESQCDFAPHAVP